MEKLTITAVGDICLGDSPKCLGFGVKSKLMKSNDEFLFENIKSFLSGEIVFGNLECVLSEKGLRKNDFYSEQLRGHPDFINILKLAGFNVLNIANNHIMQHGINAYLHTIELLNKNGIHIVGEKGQDTFSRPVIIERNGVTVGFLGYSFENDRYVVGIDTPYANTSNRQIILSDIKSLRPCVDWLVLSLHWGLEFMDYPSPVTIDMAKVFVDAGVDVILGHHPHVVQPIVRYNNSVICYSMGNLIFDMVWNKECLVGVIVEISLQKGCSAEVEVIPLKINDSFVPVISSGSLKNDFFIKMNLAEKKSRNLTVIDIEKSNLLYYQQSMKEQKKDMWLSNLFLLRTLCWKTPIRFLPGKLGYLISKFSCRKNKNKRFEA